MEGGVTEGSTRGKLLIASPALVDPNFARTVVFITEHNEEGAMGIVLNRPSETSVDSVVPELAEIAGGEPVYVGGPVQPEALVLLADFSDPEAAAWIVVADVGLASADVDLDELAETVRRGRVYAGYSGWGPGQLEEEMEIDSWIVEAPLPAELFPEDPATLWSDVLARKGGQYALIARMPADPSQN
ncbi:MAG TPA: YqgE/AlgH family protein [Solirubrobacterales bacterium]|nr:YqgE/AlgH family protein [Solirubrobacterales bacterium]